MSNALEVRRSTAVLDPANVDRRLARSPEDDPGSFIMGVLGLLRRRWRWIAGFAVLMTLAAGLVAMRMPPSFVAQAELVLDPSAPQTSEFTDAAPGDRLSAERLGTERQVLLSRGLRERVVSKLGLANVPGFGVPLEPEDEETQSLGEQVLRWLTPWLTSADAFLVDNEVVADGFVAPAVSGALVPPAPDQPLTPEQEAAGRFNEAVYQLSRAYDVSILPGSRVLRVTTEASSSGLAAEISNAITDEYLVLQREQKRQRLTDSLEWLRERTQQVRADIAAIENDARAIREGAGLQEGVNADLVTEQLSDVTRRLVEARSNLANLEAQTGNAQAAVARNPNAADFPAALNSPTITQLLEQQAALEGILASYVGRYGPSHRAYAEVNDRLAQTRLSIAGEVRRLVASLEQETSAASELVSRLEREAERLRLTSKQFGTANLDLERLDAEAVAQRDVLAEMLGEYQRLEAQVISTQPDAIVISNAIAPMDPNSPSKKILLAGGLVLGSFLGLAAGYVRDITDRRVQAIDTLERAGVPTICVVPRLKSMRGQRRVVDRILQRFALSIVRLWANVTFTCPGLKTLAVTSPSPGDGKSTLAATLTRMRARQGARVVIVECDMLRPKVVDLFPVRDSDIGLRDVLAGHETVDAALRESTEAGVWVLGRGTASIDPVGYGGLWEGHAFPDLLRDLSERFDLVVLDCPPVLANAESLYVARAADAAILCVRSRATRMDHVSASIEMLMSANANLVGAVLNATSEREAEYGHYG